MGAEFDNDREVATTEIFERLVVAPSDFILNFSGNYFGFSTRLWRRNVFHLEFPLKCLDEGKEVRQQRLRKKVQERWRA